VKCPPIVVIITGKAEGDGQQWPLPTFPQTHVGNVLYLYIVANLLNPSMGGEPTLFPDINVSALTLNGIWISKETLAHSIPTLIVRQVMSSQDIQLVLSLLHLFFGAWAPYAWIFYYSFFILASGS